jgi:hypothetical protein
VLWWKQPSTEEAGMPKPGNVVFACSPNACMAPAKPPI